MAKVHIILEAKDKEIISGLDEVSEEKHASLLGHMLVVVAQIAKQEKLEDGFRIVVNNGKHGGQKDHLVL